MHMDFQTIILRFRDLVTEENGTIKRHQDVIAQNGYVWWAWWKKGNETTPVPEFSSLATNAKTAPVNLFLVDSGQGLVYRAKCEDVDLRAAQKIPSPETDKTPEYYRDQEYYAWFKFTQIEQCDESDLKRRDANINSECMHCVAVVGMGSTGASGVQNKFATIRFERDDVLIDFYNIYSDESSEGHLCQSMRLSLK